MVEQKKLRIGILSDSPFLTTGYSDQAKYLGNYLADVGHEIFFFAHTYTGQDLEPPISFEDGRQLKFKVIGQGREQYFKDLLSAYLKKYKIDVFIILLDTFMLYPWILQLDLSPARTVFWFPSDGGGALPLNCEQILRKIDAPVAMAKFGQAQCKKVHDLDVLHIPHCIDPTNYYRLSDEERIKIRQTLGIENKFVIGVVARNQGRKMLDRTIKAMAVYAKINPNAVLLLHLDPNDNAQVFPINALVQRYNLENRVMYTGTTFFKGFTFKEMNAVYNAMDVFLLTTSGEGFGIPLIEAQACGIPVLATDYTTTRELVIEPEAGLGIDLVGTTEEENPDVHGTEILDGTLTGSWAVERGMCSISDTVKKLDLLFKDKELRTKLGTNGIINVLSKYTVENVGKQWNDLVIKLGGEY